MTAKGRAKPKAPQSDLESSFKPRLMITVLLCVNCLSALLAVGVSCHSALLCLGEPWKHIARICSPAYHIKIVLLSYDFDFTDA